MVLRSEDAHAQELQDLEGSKNLYRSLILRGIRDFVTYKRHPKRRFRDLHEEAKVWIFGNSHSDDALDRFMSFDSACEVIGWDPNRVRKRVQAMRRTDLKKLGPQPDWDVD